MTLRRRVAVRELVHVQFANDHGARSFQPADHLRILRRDAVRKYRTAGSRPHSRGIEKILETDGNSVQGPAPSPVRNVLIRGSCICHCPVGGHSDERVQGGIEPRDTREACARQFGGRDLPRAYQIARFRQCQPDQVVFYPRNERSRESSARCLKKATAVLTYHDRHSTPPHIDIPTDDCVSLISLQ